MNITTKIERKELIYDSGVYCKNVGVGSYNNYDNSIHLPLMVFTKGGMSIPYGTTADRPTNINMPILRFNTDTSALELYHPSLNKWGNVGDYSGEEGQYAIIAKEHIGSDKYSYVGILKNQNDSGVLSIDLQSKRDNSNYCPDSNSVQIGTNLKSGPNSVLIGHNTIGNPYASTVSIGTNDINETLGMYYPKIGNHNTFGNNTSSLIIGNNNDVSSIPNDSVSIIIGNNINGEDRPATIIGNEIHAIRQYRTGNKIFVFPKVDMDTFNESEIIDGEFTFGISYSSKEFVVKTKIDGDLKEVRIPLDLM